MADPLAGLRDIHVPATAWPEMAAAMALGLLAALALAQVIRLFAWKPPTRAETVATELLALNGLGAGERLLGIARIAQRHKLPPIAGLQAALYEKSPGLAPGDAETLLLKRLREARR